ncbi:hypothetical protein [Kitasatospora sp. NPDC127116]|uniref:hypothetical protein n=1 Tax=Kitasatospora sp. NPDC127116 TaxID=3345367 RepID=UPI003644DC7E
MQYTLTSGSIGPDRRWGWLLATADGQNLGYHDGMFASDPDADASAARDWANSLTGGATEFWAPVLWSAHGPRSYTSRS